MRQETKDLRGRIPPLPQVKPYEPIPYDAAGLIEPFRASKLDVDRRQQGGGLQPDLNRPKEPLESFPLESIKYVGVMTRGRISYAIVTVDGALFRVRTGSYMGQNFGVITNVSETEISLRELVQDASSDWIERPSTLQLQTKEGK
jgi:type IV pilus assembly protein PilP